MVPYAYLELPFENTGGYIHYGIICRKFDRIGDQVVDDSSQIVCIRIDRVLRSSDVDANALLSRCMPEWFHLFFQELIQLYNGVLRKNILFEHIHIKKIFDEIKPCARSVLNHS